MNDQEGLNLKDTGTIFLVPLICILLLICVSVANAADLNIENKVASPEDKTIWVANSGNTPDHATYFLSVTNLVPATRSPLDVILAIDSTGSLTGSDPQRLRVVAAKNFVDKLDPNNDRVGVVLWNNTIIGSPLPLTSNFSKAKTYLNLSESYGETCIYKALNASEILLSNARPSAKKVIILFSDGFDTCETPLDFKGLAQQIRSSGTDIYTIGLGQSNIADLEAIGKYHHASDAQAIPSVFQDIATEILGSLDGVQVNYMIPNDIDISNPSETANIATINGERILTWYIGYMVPNQTKTLTFDVSSKVLGTYTLAGSDSSVATYTKRDGTKGIQNVPAVEVNVKDIPRFFYAGNGKGGALNDPFYPGYNVTVTKDILPPTGSGCQDVAISVTTPSIPCNKYVVFALDNSGSTLQSGIGGPMINAIKSALNSNNGVYYARVDWHNPDNIDLLRDPTQYSSNQFYSASNWPERNLVPSEEYGTSYTGGLNEALRLIKTEQAKMSSFDNKTRAWIVVFIAGKSEYNPATAELAQMAREAKQAGIKIYTLGVDITGGQPETQFEYTDLNTMSGGQFISIPPNNVPNGIYNAVTNILQQSCDNISSQPVAENVVVTDSIYPYLKVAGTSIRPDVMTSNSDGTTTLVWKLGDMSQSQTKTIIINTALDFNKLPIDVSNKRTPVSFSPSAVTPPSVVTYTAITDKARVVPLPEGELSVFCGSSPSSPVAKVIAPAPPATLANNTSEEKKPATTRTPGFEASVAVGGLTTMIYLLRRKNEEA